MNNVFEQLNGSDALLGPPTGDSPADAARRRVLGRLGQYAALVVGPLNLRPTGATLLAQDEQRVEVRISTAGSHIVLVIAIEGDLAAEVFFLRALADRRLPIPRLIGHDLSRAVVPFSYALESYVGGVPLDRLADGPLMRVAARQLGRTLRRAHQTPAPGFGQPTAAGRWPGQGWADTLRAWLAQRDVLTRAVEVLGAEGAAAWQAATLEHPALAWDRPCVIHGAVAPDHAIVTVGDSAQLEALVRPGAIVGGDPLFDLAHGLLPRHPAAFRQGLLEGYTASGALAPDQEGRLCRLRLLIWVADTLARADAPALARLPGAVAEALASLAPR